MESWQFGIFAFAISVLLISMSRLVKKMNFYYMLRGCYVLKYKNHPFQKPYQNVLLFVGLKQGT